MVRLAGVLILGFVLSSPMLAHAQAYKGEFKGIAVSESSGALAEAATIDVLTAPIVGAGFLIITQACSSLGNDEGIVETPTSSVYLELRGGCTTFTPGFVWPSGEIVRLRNVNGSGQTGSIWINGVQVKK
jgi:hypothetical protein